MTEPSAASAEELGRTYGAMLGEQDWQVDAVPVDPPDVAEVRSPEAPPPPLRIVEAMLFIGGAPLAAARACEAVRGLTEAQFTQIIDTLNRDYRTQGRPYAIQAHEHGYQLVLRPKYQDVVEKVFGAAREARLSPAAIDVLSLVAYRQPATKQEIDSFRGAESGAILRQLVRRGLIAIVERAEAPEREARYGTTPLFLELFGLRSLDDLPQTQDLQRL